MPWSVEHTHRNVVTVRMDGLSGSSERWFLLRSDAHHDNPECDQDLERKHLLEAKARDAGVIDAGDLFCAMQGKWDKRAEKSKLRPEHQGADDYFDALKRTAADFYKEFAPNFVVIGQGNHESAVLKRHESDLTTGLVERLNTHLHESRSPHRVQRGGYSGWVRFQFNFHTTKRDTKTLYYHHASGGGGPVTRGVIQTNRFAVFIPNAHVVLTGHTHDQWIVPIARFNLSAGGVPYQDEQIHVRGPGYKDGWGDGYGGFETERMLGPKPRGANWLRFYMQGSEIRLDVTRAT